jgi:glyoxylase I family protein
MPYSVCILRRGNSRQGGRGRPPGASGSLKAESQEKRRVKQELENTALMPTSPPLDPQSPFASMKGHHVALRVPDFEASKRWYVEKLDFRVLDQWISEDPPLRLAYLAPANNDLFYIELIGDGSYQPKPHYTNLSDSLRQAGYHHFCLNVANLDNTIAELRRRGVTIVKEAFEVEAINRRLAFFSDPWGNLIELAQIIAKR